MRARVFSACLTGGSAACVLVLCAVHAQAATLFTYNGFASTAGLTLVGMQRRQPRPAMGRCCELTPASGYQSGAAYSTTPVTLGNNATFSTQFQFRFTNQGGIGPG